MLDVEIPKLRAHVNDDAHLLSPEEARALDARLVAHEHDTGQQLVLLTIERLPKASIDDLGYTIFNRWKLGRACYDDGVLLLIALADHMLRIEVGYGLERAIPDARAAEVIQEMGPHLRLQQYAAAVNLAFDKLAAAAAASPAVPWRECELAKRGWSWP